MGLSTAKCVPLTGHPSNNKFITVRIATILATKFHDTLKRSSGFVSCGKGFALRVSGLAFLPGSRGSQGSQRLQYRLVREYTLTSY